MDKTQKRGSTRHANNPENWSVRQIREQLIIANKHIVFLERELADAKYIINDLKDRLNNDV